MASYRRAVFQLPGEDDEGDGPSTIPEDTTVQDIERIPRRYSTGKRRPRYGSTSGHPMLGVEGESFYQNSLQLEQSRMVNIHRPIYSQSDFQRCFEENMQGDLQKRFWDNVFMPKMQKWSCKRTLLDMFPLVNVLRHYNWKRDIGFDLMSGVTTGAMRIPQSMAYAFLARLAPASGLYTAFFSAIFYVIFGGAHHMVTGAQGVLSLMLGSGIERYLSSHHINASSTNSSFDYATEAGKVAIPITLLAGLMQMTLGLFRLGFITNYLSDPLVGGFTTGAACHVFASLLKDFTGLVGINASGWFKCPVTIYNFFKNIGSTNVATLTISMVAVILLSFFKFINKKCSPRFPVPGELIVMVLVIIFSYFTQADQRWNVSVVGDVPAGFKTPELPDPNIFPQVLDVAFTTAIVSFAIGYSIAKRLALKHDYDVKGNQEVFAFGFMNSAQSFFHGFVSTSSMSVSELHDSLGGVSQLANLVAAAIVLVVILSLGFVFRVAPDCLLSAIILVNLRSILMQFGDLCPLWRVSKIDFLLWMVTWTAVVILDVDIGLLIGVTFSLLTVVFRTQWPYVCELGRIPSTDLYKNRDITPEAVTIDGIRIFRFEGSLYFASAEHFRKSVYKQPGCNPHKIIGARQNFEKQIEKLRKSLRVIEPERPEVAEDSPLVSQPSHTCQIPVRSKVHHIIFDFSTCSFMDSVGLRALNQCIAEYKEAGISVYLANVRAAVRAILFNEAQKSGVSARKTFLSVHDAVLAALEAAQREEERNDLLLDAVNAAYYRHNVSISEPNPRPNQEV